ncbi:hypothetical protein ARMGADRAFT_1107180 [Armillaria gallica]|uniref:Uncharacterized protein n=1 Tax=Armillaria gallica TaxID=47427 RepID=A0A2H3DQA8_ARMGA|nr:hypothetical protein ARMGADRAFT_1107180 [Armillaria gallica]
MEEQTGYNILCPFGGSKIVLVDGTLSAGKWDELEEEMSTPNLAENNVEDSNSTGHMPPSLEPDFDDLCDFAAATMPSNLSDSSSEKVHVPYNAWVQINPFSTSTLALLGVTAVQWESQNILSIPVEDLHKPSVFIEAKIMELILTNIEHQPNEDDWEWTGKFEQVSAFCSRLKG